MGGGKFEYYKSMGGTTKKGGNKQWGEAKGGGGEGGAQFGLKFSGVGWDFGGNYEFQSTNFGRKNLGIKQP